MLELSAYGQSLVGFDQGAGERGDSIQIPNADCVPKHHEYQCSQRSRAGQKPNAGRLQYVCPRVHDALSVLRRAVPQRRQGQGHEGALRSLFGKGARAGREVERFPPQHRYGGQSGPSAGKLLAWLGGLWKGHKRHQHRQMNGTVLVWF